MSQRKTINIVFGVYLCMVAWAAWQLSQPKGRSVKYQEMTEMSEEELRALIDYNEDPTVKAVISLELSSRHMREREQMRADTTPLKQDRRPSWSNFSPREQIMRVNEVLGTPNEPDPRLR